MSRSAADCPSSPWIPEDVHGKPIIAIFVCHTGKIEDGEKLVAPLKSFGSPAGDIIQRRSYVSQQSILDATQPKGRRYYWKSEFLPDLEPELLKRTMQHAKSILSPFSAIFLFPLHGALNEKSEDHSAIGNRKTAWVINIAASWEDAQDDDRKIEWAKEAWRDIRQFSTGGTYINFLTQTADSNSANDTRILITHAISSNTFPNIKRRINLSII